MSARDSTTPSPLDGASHGLLKKLRRLFNEVRREAKRNPAFAARLDAALDLMTPSSLIDDDDAVEASGPIPHEEAAALELNPVAIARREGVEGLRDVIAALPETALRGLIAEHNLDPADQSTTMRKDLLVDFVLSQAARRIERDQRLFEY